MCSYCCTSLLYRTKSAPPIKQTRPLTWVGLSGLEPLTSSLSGSRGHPPRWRRRTSAAIPGYTRSSSIGAYRCTSVLYDSSDAQTELSTS